MLNRDAIAGLIPHHGAMCLLDRAESWDAGRILCRAGSHLAADNPLRRGGRLGAVCGCEYGFQAAALHGALMAGGTPQPPGYVVALRVAVLSVPYLDDPALGELAIEAMLEAASPSGMVYGLRITAAAGTPLIEARATISLAAAAA